MGRPRVLLSWAGVSLLVATVARADIPYGTVYWTNRSTVQRAYLDGSGFQTIVSDGLNTASGIDVDLTHGKLYFADLGADLIERCNFDGSDVETLSSHAYFAYTVRLDLTTDKLYWSARAEAVHRANLDGSGDEIVFQPAVEVWGMDLDTSQNKIYWATGYSGQIYRANLDGSNAELLVSGSDAIPRVRLDVADGKMYWASFSAVQRANLDGTDVETLVTGIGRGIGIALDLTADKLYWSDNYGGTIGRANLDGSDAEIIVALQGPPYSPNPLDLAVIPVPEPNTLSLLTLAGLLVAVRRR